MTTSALTALDILKETRDLFAATHWTTGTIYGTDPKTGKKKFCMVGGLCHIFAKHELPEWLEKSNLQSFYAADPYVLEASFTRVPDLTTVLQAERELAKTIDLTIDDKSSPELVESTIVNWNDDDAREAFEVRGDASYVIETMDKTIERVESQNS